MIVDDYMQVYGRGWLIIAYDERLSHMELNLGDKIIKRDVTFTITGIERAKYDEGWWSNRVGLVLSPNNLVPSYFELDEEIEIISSNE